MESLTRAVVADTLATIRTARRGAHLLAALGAALVLLAAVPARAQIERPSTDFAATELRSNFDAVVSTYSGDFTTHVAIAAPAFHGLEPQLGLGYRSSAPRGQLGVGWTLGGAPSIRRAGQFKGVPKWNGNDIYLQGSQQLIACTSLGGTHCTQRQNFSRIVFDATNNLWTETRKDGTTLRFGSAAASRLTTTAGTAIWYLDRVQDRHGNTVTYSYWTDTGVTQGDVYLDTVTYNGTTIKLYRELRPDTVRTANGVTMTQTRYRLTSIDVQVSGARLGAYQLTYAASPKTGLSRVASIQRFGSDAAVDANGVVSGGTALPATTFTYSPQPSGFKDNSDAYGVSEGYVDDVIIDGQHRSWDTQMLDMDGDGLPDWVHFEGTTGTTSGTLTVALNTGNGFGSSSTWADPFSRPCGHCRANNLVDVTGDGRPRVRTTLVIE